MTKVVFNECFGGFGLSEKAHDLYKKKTGRKLDEFTVKRHDPALVEVVEELGDEANDRFSMLRIAEIKGDLYRIDEYDGYESVEEPEDIEWEHA